MGPTIDSILEHEFLSKTVIDELDNEPLQDEVIQVLKCNLTQNKLRNAIGRVRLEQIETTTTIDAEATMKEQFKRIDLDGDGYTSIDELTQLLTSLGYALNFAQKEAKEIMLSLDLDGDGSIDFNEFAQAWVKRQLSINDKYAHAIFHVFDTNGDGYISIQELKSALFVDYNN